MASGEVDEQMQIVVDSLRDNPDAVVVGGSEALRLQNNEFPSGRRVVRALDVYVHPSAPTYDADGLNEFMSGIAPELHPVSDTITPFQVASEELQLGRLSFMESIGSVTVSATVRVNPEMSATRLGIFLPEWQSGYVDILRQQTDVRIFPDRGHAIDAFLVGRNKDSIPLVALGKNMGKRDTDLSIPSILRDVVDPSATRP